MTSSHSYDTSRTTSRPTLRVEDAAVIDQAERILQNYIQHDRVLLDAPHMAGEFLRMHLAGKKNEVFVGLFLDTHHRLIACEDLFFGTIDGCNVHSRVILQKALEYNCAAIIFGHNHPSGVCEPSAADRALTIKLKQELQIIDVRLIDHYVVGGNKAFSMAARGWV